MNQHHLWILQLLEQAELLRAVAAAHDVLHALVAVGPFEGVALEVVHLRERLPQPRAEAARDLRAMQRRHLAG